MDFSPHNPRLTGALVLFVCLLFAIFLGYIIGTEGYGSLLLGTVIALGCCLWFFSGRFLWVLIVASSFLGGTFPILGGAFTPFQILMAMGLVKFVIEDVILRRIHIKLPSRFDVLMIAGFMAVITIHGVQDRFGMRFLGSSVWGGRQYVNVFVGLAAFFVIQSIPMKPGLWAKFPYVVLIVAGFDLLVALVTTVFPGTIYAIYPFYSAVSNSSLQEALGGPSDAVTGRIGAIGNFGVLLIILILSVVSMRRLFHPSNLIRVFLLGLASLGVLLSGYRTSVGHALLAALVAGIRDLKLAALALLPLLAAALFTLSVVNSEIVALPKQFQRALAFVPGNWDTEMAQDVRASNDFRFTVWTLWWRQYFPEQPILGRGFGFKMEWSKQSVYYGSTVDHRQMVETGNIHNGFLAALDTFGILGTIFFIAWNVVMLLRAFRVSYDQRRGDYLALRFLALYLAVSIIFYWGGATSIGSFLPREFALAGLFLRLSRDLKPAEEKRRREPTPATHRQFRRELVRV